MKEQTILSLWKKQKAQSQNRHIVFDEDRALTAEELDALSDTIAAMLPRGVRRVGIIMEHSAEMIAAIFAVLKAGAAYVPAEPTFPIERIAYMLNDAEADCVITQKQYAALAGKLPVVYAERGMTAQKAAFQAVDIHSSDLAYILYTSGSTGMPKGVAVEHGNVCHYVRAFANEFHPAAEDIMLQYSVCTFDIFVEEVFASLLSGAALAIPSAETKNSLPALMRFADEHNITMISGFPYLLKEMNELPSIPKSLRLLISGGDVLRYNYVSNLLGKAEIYNTYGPSETTVCASYFRCRKDSVLEDGTFPIGKAVLGTQIFIADEDLNPVLRGEIGEICILGEGVSRGYIGNLPKENRAFTHTADGRRLYRSGDLGYFLPDGNIAFLRRKDSQVMIYGKRVEPMEVENVLLQCEGVTSGCVRAAQDENGLSYLTAYITTEDGVSVHDIKNHLHKYLADFMIPEYFVRMNGLPLNANGKIDIKALPQVMRDTPCTC